MNSAKRVLFGVIFFGLIFPISFTFSFAIFSGILTALSASEDTAIAIGFVISISSSLTAAILGFRKVTSKTISLVNFKSKMRNPNSPIERSYSEATVRDHSPPTENDSSELKYDLSDAMKILKEHHNKKLYEKQNIKLNVIDNFLYCGKFNSVLGPEGFKVFKNQLKDIVKDVNDDNFNSNFINLDKMFECLLDSGVYYLEEHTPKELIEMNQNERWLTAFRYISKNFPSIDYKDFREIVKRFKDSKMYSIYIHEKDSPLLRSISESDLFDEIIDAKAELLHLNQKQQRELCEKLGVQAARSLEETADRIIEHSGDKVLELISQDKKKKRYYKIKDLELATGEDIVQLDSYLRSISKVMREDLTQFIIKQRHGSIAA